ncbi:OmcA/MtrC family decaheme c-type cytochrome [Ferrimonas marina]|uniref:Decaheme c-type cytochrome, OmcA/MtrC family n=1 Tax=Ferrimonas marina TaxID=299255 RepID=A0A1M5YUJ3_9GAMM|nr:OmcA/MtrC family decaheme c-type cytochrome [Ferrimonas marina]SHI15510.1 decaheme c-type cytochrome, OmcA/MtrC family [Ferrimonas marina]
MTNQKQLWRLSAIAAVMATGLTACSDGNDGKDGEPGRPGGPAATVINDLILDVTNVETTDETMLVTFLATNERDEAVVGLDNIAVRRTQLHPVGAESVGDRAGWQNLNKAPLSLDDQGNGYYVAEFEQTMGFNANLTQKVGIAVPPGFLKDGKTAVPYTEYLEAFAADGGMAREDKNVVDPATCHACHSDTQSIYHGYDRGTNFETCIMCHDDFESQRRDLTLIVHDKHVLSGFDPAYKDCTTCHVDAEGYGEWGNWMNTPTIESCSVCHNDGIDDSTGRRFPIINNHMKAQGDNSQCAACHTAEGTGVVIGTYDAHMNGSSQLDAKRALADKVTVEVVSAVYNEAADADSLPSVDLLIDVQLDGTSIDVSTADFLGYYSRGTFYQGVPLKMNANALSDARENGTKVEPNLADGVFTENGMALTVEHERFGYLLPGEQIGVYAFVEACLDANSDTLTEACNEDSVLVSAAETVALFNQNGIQTEDTRRTVVSNETCRSCHADPEVIYHYGRETEQGCQTCHAALYAGYGAADNMTDGMLNSSDFKMMVHTLHADNRPRRTEAERNVTNYPAAVSDCAQCHEGNTFGLDLVQQTAPVAGNVNEDVLYTSPAAATCASCHSDDSAINHMKQAGGATFGADTPDLVGVETCAVCHSVEDIAGYHSVKL